MNTTLPTAHELREQAVAAVRHGQETTLTVIRHVVEALSSASSKLPSTPEGLRVPLADKLPSRESVVAGAYDFAEQLLAEQRKFAEEFLKITARLRHSSTEDAAQATDTNGAQDTAEEAGSGE
jgi:hypothetical protein